MAITTALCTSFKQEILEAQFEAYYQRREEKKAKASLKKMLKEIGIEPYKKH